MNVSDKVKDARADSLEGLNGILKELEQDDSLSSIAKGSLVRREALEASPVGMILLANPKNPQPFYAYVKGLPHIDFRVTSLLTKLISFLVLRYLTTK